MPLTIRRSFIPAPNANRPGILVTSTGTKPGQLLNNAPLWITVHETGNPNFGANAEMHRVFVHQGGGPSQVSFHFVVDDKEAIQLLPLNEIGWHAADGCNNRQTDIGCFQSVAIETCVNNDGDWNKTFDNLCELIACIIEDDDRIDYAGRKGQFSRNRITTHKAVSDTNKDCPARILARGLWNDLLAKVATRLDRHKPTTYLLNADGTPSNATLKRWFGTVREYNPDGVVSKAWRAWCLRHGLWPRLTAVEDLPFPHGMGALYVFENRLYIAWDGRQAYVVGQKG